MRLRTTRLSEKSAISCHEKGVSHRSSIDQPFAVEAIEGWCVPIFRCTVLKVLVPSNTRPWHTVTHNAADCQACWLPSASMAISLAILLGHWEERRVNTQ